MTWWFWITIFLRLSPCIEIASFHPFGKVCTNCNLLNFIFFIFHTSPSIIHNNGASHHCQSVVRQSWFHVLGKLEKMTDLLSIRMLSLSHKNWEAIDDGREGGEDG